MRSILAFAVAISSASCVVAEEKAVEIPLKSIWAWGMPGTQSVQELDPEVLKALEGIPKDERRDARGKVLAFQMKEKSLVYRFLNSLDALAQHKWPAKGFAVSGTGLDALRNTALARLDKPVDTLPEGEVTIVFFARQAGEPVHLQKVTRRDGEIKIRYRLAPRGVFVNSDHFALIPLGKLAAGTYSVEIDSEQQKRIAAEKVCKPFSFTVEAR